MTTSDHELKMIAIVAGVIFAILMPASFGANDDNAGQIVTDAGMDPMQAIHAALEDELFEMAVDLLERNLPTLAADDEAYASGLVLLARAYHALDRHEDILKRIDTDLPAALQNSVAAADLLFWRTVAYHHLERNDKVLELTETFQTQFPEADRMADVLPLRAAALTAANGLDEALAIYAQAVGTYPDAPQTDATRLAWAKTLILDGRHDEATAKLEALATDLSDPVGREAAYWQGQLELQAERYDEARAIFRKLLDFPGMSGPETGRFGMAKAEVLEKKNQLDDAVAVLDKILARLPPEEHRRPITIESARLMFETGHTDAAAERLSEVIRAAPRRDDVPELQLKLAYGLLRGEKHDRAADEFQVYLDAFTNRVGQAEALTGLGWSFLAMDRTAEAAERFEKAAQQFDSTERRSKALFKAADAWFTHERFAAALDRYQSAAETAAAAGVTQRVTRARYLAAESMIRLEHYDEAIAALTQLVDDFADSADAAKALLRIAKLHEEREDLREALAAYEIVPQRVSDPDIQADSLLSSGMILYTLFRFDDALEKFNRLLDQLPEHPYSERASFMRVWAYSMTGREDEALNAAHRFLEHYGDSERAPEILFRIAENQFNQEELAKAQNQFFELAERYPKSAVAENALLWAGRTAARRQNYAEAIELFARLVADYPDSPRVAEARFSQADALSALGEFADAKVLFNDVIEHTPASYLRPAAIGRKGDCQFMLGNQDPQYYREAILSYRKLLELAESPDDMRLQALYKIGRCHEHLDDKDLALEFFHAALVRFREMQYQGIRPAPTAVWGFQRAAFDAAGILESRRKWRQAVNILQRVVDADVPASAQAATRIERLRDEHWMLLY